MRLLLAVRVLLISLMVSALIPGGVAEASARAAKWVVSVTYQNVGSSPATVQVDFYPEGSGTPISFNPLGSGRTLAAGAGASFFTGSVQGLPAGFRGSAVMSSDEPLVATVVQFSEDAGVNVRMLSNGFTAADASDQYLMATTLARQWNRTSVFSIQNTETAIARATVRFYDANAGGALVSTRTYDIPAGSSKYIEMDNSAALGLPSTFNGSAIVSGALAGNPSTPAKLVATASELFTNKNVGANFGGVPLSRAANTVYMATALCERFGLDTYYAVQNASLNSSASITVQYYNTDGSPRSTDGPYSVGPGQKQSIITCSPSSGTNMSGFTGSARVTSTGAPIVAVGKAEGSAKAARADTRDVFAIFLGEAEGYSRLSLPFVRYANDTNYFAAGNMGGRQRAYIAIQNLESTSVRVNVKYYDRSGGLVATHPLTIAGHAKGNSDAHVAGALGRSGMNPSEFGYYTDGGFGGAVIIEADAANPNAKLIAIARVQHPGAGEDYNAMPVP